MFNDRDLFILGGGAFLAIACLFLPLPFVGKVAVGITVLIIAMIFALLRLGPDRVPVEEWLRRRIQYQFGTKRYVFHRDSYQTEAPVIETAPEKPVVAPLRFELDEVGFYPLMTVFLIVVGVYFVVWINQGGYAELALFFH